MNRLVFNATIATTLLLASCNNDSVPTNVDEQVPLRISQASIESLKTRGSFDDGGLLTTGGTLGLFVTGTSYNYSGGVEYYYNATVWEARTETVFLNNNPASIRAVAPYISEFNLSNAALTAGKYEESKDICVSRAVSVSNTSPTATLALEHLYSRITFRIRKDSSYSGTGKITAIKLDNQEAIYPDASVNLSGENPVITYGTPGVVQYDPVINSLTEEYTPSSMLLIPVSTFTSATAVIFTVDGVNLSASIPAVSPASGINELLASHNYTVNVNIQGTTLTLGNVTVSNWTPETAPDLNPVVE